MSDQFDLDLNPDEDTLFLREVERQEREMEMFIQSCKGRVAVGEAAERLFNNTDFQLIVISGLFDKLPLHNASIMASDNASVDMREQARQELISIGFLKNYFDSVKVAGARAVEDLKSIAKEGNE